MLTALAFILGYLETLLPLSIAIPGAKLGLANLVVLTALYKLGYKDAFLLNIIRILLAAFTFGNMMSFTMSLTGGMFSYIVMAIAKKTGKVSILFVSILGGVTHNLGQIAAAVIVVKNIYVLAYFPFLLVVGMISGTLIGIVGNILIQRIHYHSY